jgi:hypothetical protein
MAPVLSVNMRRVIVDTFSTIFQTGAEKPTKKRWQTIACQRS